MQEQTPPHDPAAPHKKSQALALGLLTFCVLAALGNLAYGIRPKAHPPQEAASASHFSEIFQEKAEMAVIVVEGTIVHDASGGGGLTGPNNGSADRIVKAIRDAEKDGVKGILFKINSPGGSAAASQSVYHEIQRVRKKGIKVYAAMGDVAASGGYYIACAAEKIYANSATLTGSIGVIAQFTKVKGLFEKVGLETTVIKSGEFKDIGSPFRDTTAAERDLLQKLIDDTYQDFLQAVADGRQMPVAEVRKLADGRIYTGNQALKHKMLDKLGDYNQALADLKTASQVSQDASVKNYSQPGFGDFFSMISSQVGHLSPTAALESLTYTDLRHLNKIPLMLYY